ncbi:unnamed protein product [Spodoptera exigua]|nr:unnamed protein product [Spodoptera exigua]
MVRKMSLANKTPSAEHSGEEVTRVTAAVAAPVCLDPTDTTQMLYSYTMQYARALLRHEIKITESPITPNPQSQVSNNPHKASNPLVTFLVLSMDGADYLSSGEVGVARRWAGARGGRGLAPEPPRQKFNIFEKMNNKSKHEVGRRTSEELMQSKQHESALRSGAPAQGTRGDNNTTMERHARRRAARVHLALEPSRALTAPYAHHRWYRTVSRRAAPRRVVLRRVACCRMDSASVARSETLREVARAATARIDNTSYAHLSATAAADQLRGTNKYTDDVIIRNREHKALDLNKLQILLLASYHWTGTALCAVVIVRLVRRGSTQYLHFILRLPPPAAARGARAVLRGSGPAPSRSLYVLQPSSRAREWLEDHGIHPPGAGACRTLKFREVSPSVRRVAFRTRLKEPIDHHRRGPKGLMFSRGCGVSAMRYRDLGTEQEKEQGDAMQHAAQCLLCATAAGGWSLWRTRENGAHVSYTLLLAHILFNYLYII